jgi:protein-tyrosine phosphatase
VIDLHTHILPGLDDGARDLDESLAIARDCVADGVTAVAATPHVRDDYPTTAATILAATDELRRALADAGIRLNLYSGGEVAIPLLRVLEAAELRRLALAGSRYLLVEFPYYGWPQNLADQLEPLEALGLQPILAHPERNADVAAAPELLRPLVAAGALVQVTAISLAGGLGRATRRAAHTIVQNDLAHLIASDAHSPSLRRAGLARAAATIHDRRVARWLTTDVPFAVVAGADLPRRPAGAARLGRLHRRLRR